MDDHEQNVDLAIEHHLQERLGVGPDEGASNPEWITSVSTLDEAYGRQTSWPHQKNEEAASLKIVHFEVTANTPKRTAEFFEEAFGWAITESKFIPNYYMLGGSGEDGGAVMDRSQIEQPVVVWFEAPDLDAALKKVRAAGGKAIGSIKELPGVGRLVYAAEPDGVVFGLKEPAQPT